MSRINRHAKILECVISEYIRTLEPIGSEQLKSLMGIDASSATIRNHLRALMQEGLLIQTHASGGRMPSTSAMQAFWSNKLAGIENTAISSVSTLESAAQEYQISATVRFFEPNTLKKVISADGKYVIGEFEQGEILFNGGADLYKFLQEFIGYDMLDVKSIAERFGVSEVAAKISRFTEQKNAPAHVINPDELLNIARSSTYWAQNFLSEFMNGYIMYQTPDGLYFENIVPIGFIALKTEAKIEDKNAQMLCVGSLHRDFSGFFANISQ